MIITLKNDKFTSQIDSFGAQLISLKDVAGTEYIWQRKAPHWDQCAPILFPVVGRPLNGVITVGGKDYSMPLHGFAAEMDFDIIETSNVMAKYSLKSNEKTRTMYPYEFELIVTFTLDDAGMNTEMKVTNTDGKEIVFGIGGHPAICCPMFDGDSFDDYRLEFDKEYKLFATNCDDEESFILSGETYEVELNRKSIQVNKKFLERNNTWIIEEAPFDKLNLVNADGRGVRFEFENFKTFAVWTEHEAGDAPFLCLEPWNSMGKRTGETSVLKDKKDIIILETGKDFVCSYKICPIE